MAGVLVPLLTWWQARRQYRSNPAIFSSGRYAITETGWKVSVPGMQGETAFSSMIGWAENREVFLLYLTLSKPEYVHPLYHTLIGGIMLVVMVVLLTVGVFWMSKVAKVDV